MLKLKVESNIFKIKSVWINSEKKKKKKKKKKKNKKK